MIAIVQELVKINLKINVIPNGLEQYMRFIINYQLVFIESFQFLSCSLDILVKNLSENDFKYLSQEFDLILINIVLDLAKQKEFYRYKYMSGFRKFREKLHKKGNLYSSLVTKITKIFLRFKINLQ